MPLLAEHNDIWILKCQCGWNFLSLSADIVKCPQCRDEVKYCQKCGDKIKRSNSDNYCRNCLTKKDVYCLVCGKEKENFSLPFCNYCQNIEKTIIRRNMSKRIERVKTFKESLDTGLCNYDCVNCIYDDCIQPVDDDDLILPLFD